MTTTLDFPRIARKPVVLPHRNRVDVWSRVHSGFIVRTIAISTALNPDRRELASRNLDYFLRNYLGHRYYDPNDTHLQIVKCLQDAILSESLVAIKQALAAPRSIGKTTIVEGAIIWAMLFGHRKFIAFIGANKDKAENRILSIKTELLNNPEIEGDFPEIIKRLRGLHNGDPRRAPADYPWSVDSIRLPNGVWLIGVGIDGSLPGMDKLGIRPDFIVADDIETVSSIRSTGETAAIEQRIRLEMLRLHDINRPAAYFFVCTVRGRGCISDRFTNRKIEPEWRGLRFKALLREPDNLELWEQFKALCQLEYEPTDEGPPVDFSLLSLGEKDVAGLTPGYRTALRFYLRNKEAMDAGAELLDCKRLSLPTLYQIRSEGKDGEGEETFLCELQNDPPDENSDNMDRRKWDANFVRSHATDYSPLTLPADCAAEIVTMGADVHAAAIYYVFRAWAMNGTSWGIEQGISEIHLDAKADKIEREQSITSALRRLWSESQQGFKCGEKMLGLRIGFVDEGWEPDIVRAMCIETQYIWRCVKGFQGLHRPRFEKMSTYPTSINLGVDHFKNDLARLLMRKRSKDGIEAGYWHLHRSPSHSYVNHMCSEEWRPKGTKSGTDVQEFHWETLNRNNHWWDCENYATAAAFAAGVRFTPDNLPVAVANRQSHEPAQVTAKDYGGWKIGR